MKKHRVSPVRASVLTAMGLGFALASASAVAGVTWYSPVTAFEDDNLDWFIDSDTVGTPGYGVLSPGDRLISVLEFNSSQGILAGQGPSPIGPSYELTGVADITVVTAVATGSNVGNTNLPEYNFTFAPTTSGLITGGTGAVANIDGAMAVLWLDDSPDLNVINGACGTLAQCLAAASDGSPNPYAAFGITANDTDSFWVASGSNLPSVIAGLSASTSVASIQFNLEMLVNNTGRLFGTQPCEPFSANCGTGDGQTDLIGSADIIGGQGLANGAFARSDTDAQLVPIPEPGSLALLGLGLAGLAASTRRRKARS